MDQVLRGKKLASFAVRQKQLEQQRADERRTQHRHVVYYTGSNDDSNDSNDSNKQQRGNVVLTQRRPAVTTLNAFATADDSIPMPQARPYAGDAAFMAFPNAGPGILVPGTPLNCQTPVNGASPSPHILPSFAASAEEWKADAGFSTAMAEFKLPSFISQPAAPSPRSTPSPQLTAASEHDDSSVPELEEDCDGDDDDDDDYDDDTDDCGSSGDSLLEIAQPVAYHSPKVRPSVISIGSRGSSKEWNRRPPTRTERRGESTASAFTGFQASEARLLEVPESTSTVCTAVLSNSLHAPRAPPPPPPTNTVRKVISHRRMDSLKSMMKSPALSRATSLHFGSRSSTAMADILDDDYNPFETMPADLFDRRPDSATTARTITVELAAPVHSGAAAGHTATLRARRKSMKGLRKRSESIGQALKMAALMGRGTARGADASIPPTPPIPVLSLQ